MVSVHSGVMRTVVAVRKSTCVSFLPQVPCGLNLCVKISGDVKSTEFVSSGLYYLQVVLPTY